MQFSNPRSNIVPFTLIGVWALLCIGILGWIALQIAS